MSPHQHPVEISNGAYMEHKGTEVVAPRFQLSNPGKNPGGYCLPAGSEVLVISGIKWMIVIATGAPYPNLFGFTTKNM